MDLFCFVVIMQFTAFTAFTAMNKSKSRII